MNNEIEFWKDIPGYEGLYQCSSFGNIKRLAGYVKNNKGYRPVKERIIKQKYDKDGYKKVVLYKNGKQKSFYVHRLVILTFKIQVNHKNGIKDDNRLENLELVTPRENIIHSIKTGLKKNFKSGNHDEENNPNCKLKKEEVKEILKAKSNHLSAKDVYANYKDKISFSGFEQIWYGYKWKNLVKKV